MEEFDQGDGYVDQADLEEMVKQFAAMRAASGGNELPIKGLPVDLRESLEVRSWLTLTSNLSSFTRGLFSLSRPHATTVTSGKKFQQGASERYNHLCSTALSVDGQEFHMYM